MGIPLPPKKSEINLEHVAAAKELENALKAFTLIDNRDPEGARGNCHFNNVALLQAYIDGVISAAFRLGAPMPDMKTLEFLGESFGTHLVLGGRYDRFIVQRNRFILDTEEEVDPEKPAEPEVHPADIKKEDWL